MVGEIIDAVRSSCDEVLVVDGHSKDRTRDIAAAHGARVILEAPTTLTGRARPDELKEVLVNVLENARNAGATLVRVLIEPGRIVVEDDGSGIAGDALPRVFEPHFSTNTSGSGLGLSIVKRLVESWGGAVAISSKEGRGTTITIRYLSA